MVPRGGGHLLSHGPLDSTLQGHSAWVNGALLLDDGKRALSWAEDNTLRLWDLRSCRENALFIGDDPVRCCIVSRTEQTAVVGDSRGRVLIFDLPATRGKGNKFKAPDQLQDSTPAERRAAMTWAQRLKRVFMR